MKEKREKLIKKRCVLNLKRCSRGSYVCYVLYFVGINLCNYNPGSEGGGEEKEVKF